MRRLLPPMLFVPLLIVSIVAGLAVPVVGPLPGIVRLLSGALGLGVGLRLNVGGARHFARVRTNVVTFNDPTKLVQDGRFAWTRNPMYLGFVALLAGAALAVGTLSAWVGAIVFFAAANWWYIPFEERRLLAVFGDDYSRYRRRVRRWLGHRSVRA